MFKNSKDISWKIFLITSIAGISGLHHGFSSGFVSPIAQEVTTQTHILNSATFPVFASITFATQAFGAVFSIYFFDSIGRKATIAIASMFATIGWLMIAMGNTASVLIIGRAITGLGIGVQLYLTPSYVNDIAHYKSKGFYLSFFNFFIRFGVIVVYVLGIFISFRYLAICQVVINLLIILGFICLPYSPTWLVSKGAERRAKLTLMKLRKEEDTVDQEIATINTVLRNQTNMNFIDRIKLFRHWFYLKVLIIGQVYMACFGFTAIVFIYSYTSIIIKGGVIPPKIGALLVPIFGILGAIIAIFLIERLGRRTLMILGCIGIAVSYTSLAIYFTVINAAVPCLATPIPSNFVNTCKYITIWPIISVAVIALSQSISFGSVGYTFVGELFPTQVKGMISGVGILVLRITSFLSVLISPYIGNIATFYSLTALNLFSLFFVILFIPETKGLDAEQIEKQFSEQTIVIDCRTNKKHQQQTLLAEAKTHYN